MATTMVRHGTIASGSSAPGQSAGPSHGEASGYQWRVIDVGVATEVAPVSTKAYFWRGASYCGTG